MLIDCTCYSDTEVFVPLSKCTRIVPVEFSEPPELSGEIQMDVTVTGTGSARAFSSDQTFGNLLDTIFRKQKIELPYEWWLFTPETKTHIIAEIYIETK